VKIKDQDERDRLFGWMEGYMSMAEGLPDGAWQAVGEEGVKAYNEQYRMKYDPYDAWLYWAERTAQINK
jgi:hypothetical protein